MPLVGLLQTQEVFERLCRFVAAEPQLRDFVPVVIELKKQARQLAQGDANIPSLTCQHPESIPTRSLAEAVVKILSDLPPVGDDFDPEMKLGLARLLDNLVVGVTGTIFSQYPTVIPHD